MIELLVTILVLCTTPYWAL